MKNEMKKNNKGFSLVELIVVVAIMAVLMVVLAPALMRYLEKSKVQKDESAVSEVIRAAQLACSDATAVDGLSSGSYTIKVSDGSIKADGEDSDNGLKTFMDEVRKTTDQADISFTSKTHKGATYEIVISVDGDGAKVAKYDSDQWNP